MIKRFFQFYNVSVLFTILIIMFFISILEYGITLSSISIPVFILVLIMLTNVNMWENLSYIIKGNLNLIKNKFLSFELINEKEAKYGNNKPLFIVKNNEYYYYDNDYK